MDNVKHRKPSTEPLKKLEKALGSKIKAVVIKLNNSSPDENFDVSSEMKLKT